MMFASSDSRIIRSRWWFLLPIMMQFVGGIIAYYALRQDDPTKAKDCLWLGIILGAIGIAVPIISVALLVVFSVPIEQQIGIIPDDEITFLNSNLEI